MTLGWVPKSSRSVNALLERASFETVEFGSSKSPKYMAEVGQVSTQAGTYSSCFIFLPSAAALSLAFWSLWWQKVHFSTTPLGRTETSGDWHFSMPSGHFGGYQLK